MPRRITVTFEDGSTHVYEGAPDDITPEEVTARAEQDFGLVVSSLDGGRGQSPALAEATVEPELTSNAPVETVSPTQRTTQATVSMGTPPEIKREVPVPSNNVQTVGKMRGDQIAEYQNYEVVPFSAADEQTYLQLSRDPNVSFEELRDWVRSKGADLSDRQTFDEYRKAILEGRPIGSNIAYRPIGTELLGDYTAAVDPTIDNDVEAVLERGMAYNPMGIVTRALEDLFDADQKGVSKDLIRQEYTDLSEEQVEEIHDRLIGEMRRRELINANVQVDSRDVNPVLGFVGDVVGGASPVDLIPLGRGATVGRRLAESAAANFAVDAAMQAGDIAYGAQRKYDPVQGAIAAAAGMALQGGFEAVGAGLSRVLRTTPNSPAPAPTGAPIVVPTARKGSKAYTAQIGEVQKRISEQVNELTKGWTNLPEVEVFDNFKDVPGLDNSGVAVYSRKTLEDGTVVPVIRINSEALLRTADRRKVSPESLVEAATFHESLGHHGLLSVFDKDLDAFLDDIYINGEAGFRKQVDDWLEKNKKAYANFPPVKRRILATEEILAEASEKGPIVRRKLDGVANYIKDFARTRFGMNLKYSQREIRSYLAVAHERTMKGQKAEAAPGVNKNMGEGSVVDLGERRLNFVRRLSEQPRPSQQEVAEALDFLDEYYSQKPTQEVSDLIDHFYEMEKQYFDSRTIYNDNTPETAYEKAEREAFKAEDDYANLAFYSDDPRQFMDRRTRGRKEYEKELEQLYRIREEKYRALEEVRTKNTSKYMMGDDGRIEDQDFDGRMTMILRELQDEYVPTQRSQAEAQRAARIAGLRSRQYKSEKGLQDLDIRLFQYEAVNERYQARLLRITDRMAQAKDAEDIDGYVRASDEFKRVLYEYKALAAKIQNDQAQIGRALNAMKALTLTKRNIADTLGLMGGNKADADAFAALDDPATLDALAKMMSEQIQAGNTLGAAKLAEKVGKPYWWQYGLSYLHLSMLSGLGTHAVNAYDAVNVLGRKLEERMVGAAVGTARRAFGAKDTMSTMEGLGFTYGVLRALVDADTYKNAYRAFKEGYEFQPFDARIERQDARIPYLSKINDALYASDMFWRSFHMSANMYSLGLRKAYKDGFRGKELFEETYANVVNADKELFDEAKRHADEALLVDTPSAFTSWLEAGKNIKPNMTAGQQARAFTLNLMFPFLRVSDRLIFQALKRVPLVAFVDHNTRREWGMGGAARDAVIARQLMGAALISYYWMMADPENRDQEGYIEGYGPEDYEERMGLEATGYRPETVVEEDQVMRNANQVNVTANPFNTRNNVAVLVASIRQQWEQSKKTDADANEAALLMASAMRASGTFLLKQGYAGNVLPYAEALEAGPQQEGVVAGLVGDLASRAVPAALRQFNQMYFDPIKLDTTGDKSVSDRIIGRVQSGIPGLSDLMPANLTALGEEQDQGRTLLRLGDGTEIKQGDPYTELRRLERETDKPLLTEFSGTFTYKGQTIRLTAHEKNKWQAIQGQYLRDVMLEWVTSEDWKQMSDEEKIDVVKDIKKEAYEDAKEKLLDEVLTAGGK